MTLHDQGASSRRAVSKANAFALSLPYACLGRFSHLSQYGKPDQW